MSLSRRYLFGLAASAAALPPMVLAAPKPRRLITTKLELGPDPRGVSWTSDPIEASSLTVFYGGRCTFAGVRAD